MCHPGILTGPNTCPLANSTGVPPSMETLKMCRRLSVASGSQVHDPLAVRRAGRSFLVSPERELLQLAGGDIQTPKVGRVVLQNSGQNDHIARTASVGREGNIVTLQQANPSAAIAGSDLDVKCRILLQESCRPRSRRVRTRSLVRSRLGASFQSILSFRTAGESPT